MNESIALEWRWFEPSKGKIGVAKVQTQDGKIEYRISPVDGFMEKMDVQQIVAWGARLPDAAGQAFFGGKA